MSEGAMHVASTPYRNVRLTPPPAPPNRDVLMPWGIETEESKRRSAAWWAEMEVRSGDGDRAEISPEAKEADRRRRGQEEIADDARQRLADLAYRRMCHRVLGCVVTMLASALSTVALACLGHTIAAAACCLITIEATVALIRTR